jgi:hypothetical protein
MTTSSPRNAAPIITMALFTCVLILPVGVHADAPAPQMGTAQYEERFLTGMIDHHAMAVMTSELCLQKAEHSELLSLCASIQQTQAAEIEEMQSWLTDWYGVSYDPQMRPRMERQIEMLGELSGEQFDIEFMTMMIDHHRDAVERGETCLERAFHDSLEGLCADIIDTQSEEIDLMTVWLCEWYSVGC